MLFSAAPTGCRAVYTARLACFTGRGVTAFLAVRAGCMALRTGRGVALRTDLRTTLRANPMTTPQACCGLSLRTGDMTSGRRGRCTWLIWWRRNLMIRMADEPRQSTQHVRDCRSFATDQRDGT